MSETDDDTKERDSSYYKTTTSVKKSTKEDVSDTGRKMGGSSAKAAAGGDRQWPFRERVRNLVYKKKYEINLKDFFLKKLRERERQIKKIIKQFKAPTYDDIKENRHNRLINLQNLDPSVGIILHRITKIPYNDLDILEKLERKNAEFKLAVEQQQENISRLHKEIITEISTCTVLLQQREESRSKNPLYMFISSIAQIYPNDGAAQISHLLKYFSEEEDIEKVILKWYENLNSLVPLVPTSKDQRHIKDIVKKCIEGQTYVKESKAHVKDSFTEKSWYKKALSNTTSKSYQKLMGALDLLYKFLTALNIFMIEKTFQKFPSLSVALLGSAINPRTGAILGLSTYFLNGDMNIDVSTKGILNLAGSCSVVYSILKGFYFVITSETTYWARQTYQTLQNYVFNPKIPTLMDLMSIFSNFWAFSNAIIKDIKSLIPNFDDIFIVQIYKERHNFITGFQIVCQILQDLHHHNSTQQNQILNYAFRSGLYSYNLTAALSVPYQSLLFNLGAKPNATFTEFIKDSTVDTLKDVVKETATSLAEDLANEEMQQQILDKLAIKAEKLFEEKSDKLLEKILLKLEDKLREKLPELKEQLPQIVQDITIELLESEEFKGKMAGYIDANIQHVGDTIVASIADSVFNATVSEEARKMLSHSTEKIKTSEKLSKAATSLVASGLNYVAEHPEVVENAVDAMSPIVEEGVKTAVSRGFGKAEAEGFTNTLMLGAIKGALSIGAEKATSSITEQAGYIAGNIGRKVPGVVVEAADTITETLYDGAQAAAKVGGNMADATMAMHYTLNPQTDYTKFVPLQQGTQTAPAPAPGPAFKKKKSISKSLYKKKNVKSLKLVSKNRKLPLKSFRKKKSLSVKRKL